MRRRSRPTWSTTSGRCSSSCSRRPSCRPSTLRPVHLGAALLGFVGAALAIVGGHQLAGGFAWGYLAAAGSAFIWASYSLLTRRVGHFPTAAVGLFGLVSGALALLCHAVFEPATMLSGRDLMLIGLTGLGPLGAAFFLWDAALKRGDPRRIGILSYLTPLASTAAARSHDRPASHRPGSRPQRFSSSAPRSSACGRAEPGRKDARHPVGEGGALREKPRPPGRRSAQRPRESSNISAAGSELATTSRPMRAMSRRWSPTSRRSSLARGSR